MKRFTVAVVALSGCIVGPACQAIVGIEDRVEAPPGDDGSTPALDGSTATNDDGSTKEDADAEPPPLPPQGCPAGCLPPAPAGWTGPSATYDGAESTKPETCPAAYPDKRVEGHQGMTAPAASCDCGPPTITGRSCKSSVQTWPGPCDIGTPTKIGDVTTTACFVTNTDVGANYRVSVPALVPGTCTYPSATTTKTPPSFDKVDIACGASQTTLCEGRADCVATPAPDQPYGRLCIHKEGEHACPSLDYAQRFVVYKSVADTRACTVCQATPTGGGCGNEFGTRLKSSDCGKDLAVYTKLVPGNCYQYEGSGTIIDLYKSAPSAGTCSATTGPTGNASSIEPVTFCCNQ